MNNPKIAVIGLGYVGLPLAVEFAKKYKVTGFDVNNTRIQELKSEKDHTNEIALDELRSVIEKENGIIFTTNKAEIQGFDYYIITVPTPVDNYNVPDFFH